MRVRILRKLAAGAGFSAALLSITNVLAAGGTWTVVSSPNHAPVQPEVLYDGSCTSSSFCMAVGVYAEFPPPSDPANQTLVEEWNGSSWAIVPSPSPSQVSTNQGPGQVGNYLSGVSCVDPGFCVAVGYDYNSATPGFPPLTLVEQWNGGTWSLVSAPNPSSTGDFFDGVSCLSESFCIAVGYQLVGSSYDNLAEQWNGSSWSVMSVPNATAQFGNTLNGVSCTSRSSCIAVGWDVPDSSSTVALLESWDGTSWQIDAAPPGATPYTYLYWVSCAGESFCAADGYSFTPSSTGAGTTAAVFDTWDGSAWHSTTAPATVNGDSLYGISCPKSDFCAAAGTNTGGVTGQTLIYEWDGMTWQRIGSPNPSASQSSALYGVDCLAGGFCIATGAYNVAATPAGAISQTLVLERTAVPQTPVPEGPWIPALLLGGGFVVAGAEWRRVKRRGAALPLPAPHASSVSDGP